MNSYIQWTIIICMAAVLSFFVAQAVIPEKDDATRNDAREEAAAELSKTGEPREPLVVPGEEVPVVMVNRPASKSAAAPDTKTVTASEIKTLAMTETKPVVTPDAKAVTPPPKPAAPETKTVTPVTKVAATPPKPEPAAPAPYKIERAALCGAIVDRTPQNISDRFSKDAREVFYYTHITGARDTAATIIHRWYHQGNPVQTSVLPVRSPNWRTHSKRNLFRSHEPAGEWKVEAVEPKSGKVLESAAFIVE